MFVNTPTFKVIQNHKAGFKLHSPPQWVTTLEEEAFLEDSPPTGSGLAEQEEWEHHHAGVSRASKAAVTSWLRIKEGKIQKHVHTHTRTNKPGVWKRSFLVKVVSRDMKTNNWKQQVEIRTHARKQTWRNTIWKSCEPGLVRILTTQIERGCHRLIIQSEQLSRQREWHEDCLEDCRT